jgi:phosphatidylinositol-3-phosphatase
MSAFKGAAAAAAVVPAAAIGAGAGDAWAHKADFGDVARAAVPEGAIEHVMVIDLENEDFATTFGPDSPAVYLNKTLLREGQPIPNHFGTSHVSMGNYIAQVSGQGPTQSTNNDCLDLGSLPSPPVVGAFTDIVPGTDAADNVAYPGQVVGDGCVYPAPTARSHGAITIGDQLDTMHGYHGGERGAWALRDGLGDHDDHNGPLLWRMYGEDMGDDPARDYGTPDPLGGTDCAHPPVGGSDLSNGAAPDDRYATRHNPFVYFHSVIDDPARCAAHVVPLGRLKLGTHGRPDRFSGHLYRDPRRPETTPKFMFVTPNLCNDGRDAFCAGPNVEGTTDATGRNLGGLAGADL